MTKLRTDDDRYQVETRNLFCESEYRLVCGVCQQECQWYNLHSLVDLAISAGGDDFVASLIKLHKCRGIWTIGNKVVRK